MSPAVYQQIPTVPRQGTSYGERYVCALGMRGADDIPWDDPWHFPLIAFSTDGRDVDVYIVMPACIDAFQSLYIDTVKLHFVRMKIFLHSYVIWNVPVLVGYLLVPTVSIRRL